MQDQLPEILGTISLTARQTGIALDFFVEKCIIALIWGCAQLCKLTSHPGAVLTDRQRFVGSAHRVITKTIQRMYTIFIHFCLYIISISCSFGNPQ